MEDLTFYWKYRLQQKPQLKLINLTNNSPNINRNLHNLILHRQFIPILYINLTHKTILPPIIDIAKTTIDTATFFTYILEYRLHTDHIMYGKTEIFGLEWFYFVVVDVVEGEV